MVPRLIHHRIFASARSRLHCEKRQQAARSPRSSAELPTNSSYTPLIFMREDLLELEENHALEGQ